MSTMAVQASVRNPALCDLCQKKQKFGSYNYCGKNCASQAAALCDFCHQKPKFAGHKFCSKNCGAQAKSQGLVSSGAGANAMHGGGRKGQNSLGLGSRNGMQMPQAGQILSAVAQILPHVVPGGTAASIASTAALVLPHVQALFQPQGQQGVQPIVNQALPAAQPKNFTKAQQPTNTPQSNGLNTSTPSFQSSVNANKTQARNAQCQVSGCQQPVHVDSIDGQVSRYCSKLHCEEAVKLGLSDACIMCLKMPQSGDDHFCGRACREEALSKPL